MGTVRDEANRGQLCQVCTWREAEGRDRDRCAAQATEGNSWNRRGTSGLLGLPPSSTLSKVPTATEASPPASTSADPSTAHRTHSGRQWQPPWATAPSPSPLPPFSHSSSSSSCFCSDASPHPCPPIYSLPSLCSAQLLHQSIVMKRILIFDSQTKLF